MKDECQQFDSYLAGDLSAEQAQRFDVHLLECDLCRGEIQQQQWLDGLLQSPVRLQLEPAPLKLTSATQLPTLQRRRAMLATCAIAASLFIAIGSVALVTTNVPKPIASTIQRKPKTPTVE